jgi:hypothetical protein
MKGNAKITGNTSRFGGGVTVESGGSFTKTGGIIYGSNETDTTLRNVAGSGGGAAVFVDATHKRENTVDTGQNMSKSGFSYTGQWTD